MGDGDMSWVRLDDARWDNRKLTQAGFAARGLDEAAICWSASHDADGRITRRALRSLAGAHGERNVTRLVARLVEVGRWRQVDRDTWEIHDYLQFNFSAEEVKRRREADRLRKASARKPTGRPPGRPSGSNASRTHVVGEGESLQAASGANGASARSPGRRATAPKSPRRPSSGEDGTSQIPPPQRDRLTPDERAAVDKCAWCDEAGWLFDHDGAVSRCTHQVKPPASANGPRLKLLEA